jgi:hypothetical protein
MVSLDEQDIRYETVRPLDVTYGFAASLQALSKSSWAIELPDRNSSEIEYVFNGAYDTITLAQRRYRQAASQGRLLVTSISNYDVKLASIEVKEDVSGGPLSRLAKRALTPHRVYANIVNLALAPAVRKDDSVAFNLVDRAMQTFRPEQIPTTYIFEEDETSRALFGRLGFALAPEDQEHVETSEYFGPLNIPVTVLRYAADSVASVIDAARAFRA